MIRDVVVLEKSGITLFSQSFGECHSFGTDVQLFSGFISAIQMFSETISGSEISKIGLSDNKNILFQKTDRCIFAVLCDDTDPMNEMEVKTKKISEIFEREYSHNLNSFDGDVLPFEEFGKILIDLDITQKNCGGRPECDGCPNSSKTLPMGDIIEKLNTQRSLWDRIKSKIQRD